MAEFFTPGCIEFYVRKRGQEGFKFLGTCISNPDIDIDFLHEDLTCDNSGGAPWQKVEDSERHFITATLNRLNWETYNLIRADRSPAGVRKVSVGSLVFNIHDFELYLRNPRATIDAVPGTWSGRLYKCATLAKVRESTPTRVKEVALLIECNPLYDNTTREFTLYTERPEDFPSVTPE